MPKLFETRKFRTTIITLLVLFSSLIFIQLFAKTTFKYDSFTFQIQLKVGQKGGTILAVPPIGQLFLKSHLTPWQIVITLDEVDFNKLEKQFQKLPSKQDWLEIFQQQIRIAIISLFIAVFLWGLLGAFFCLLILRIYPRQRIFLYQMGASLLMIVLLIATTILTYQPKAIEHPQYQGVLSAAPWAMNLVTMSLDNIEVIGSNLKKITEGLPVLFKQAAEIKNMGEMQTDLRVLHVSDIHNNPAAFDLIDELITDFKINMVIDTGDITDYGTAIEAKLTERIPRLKVPYIFIPGNHDSPLILKRLGRTKSVYLMVRKNLTIKGLTIIAEPDPAAFRYNSDLAPTEAYRQASAQLSEKINQFKKAPDIVAVHNRIVAENLIGKVPLIIYGHDHKYHLSTEDNTVLEDAGTTGAAGIRGLTPNGDPYSASILYWKKTPQGRLKLYAIDSIKINGVEGSLTVDRRTF